jgi:hypothetical protein
VLSAQVRIGMPVTEGAAPVEGKPLLQRNGQLFLIHHREAEGVLACHLEDRQVMGDHRQAVYEPDDAEGASCGELSRRAHARSKRHPEQPHYLPRQE